MLESLDEKSIKASEEDVKTQWQSNKRKADALASSSRGKKQKTAGTTNKDGQDSTIAEQLKAEIAPLGCVPSKDLLAPACI